jgi:hypothetical protein
MIGVWDLRACRLPDSSDFASTWRKTREKHINRSC